MLNTKSLQELINELTIVLNRHQVDGGTFTISLPPLDFMKLDEDLFYRMNKKEDGKVFTPSESEIGITFQNLIIKILKRKAEN